MFGAKWRILLKRHMRRLKVAGSVAALSIVLGLAGPISVFAATTPPLGLAGTFAILATTFTKTGAVTTITGDVGYTGAVPSGSGGGTYTVSGGTDYGPAAPYSGAGTAQGNVLTALNIQPCTHTFPAGVVNLATDTTHGPIGVYTPGVYCTQTADGAMNIGTAGITLSGAGTYIFRTSAPSNALGTVAASVVSLANGASSCNVFWTPTAATTLGANSTFVGTVIDDAGITVGANTLWNGRAWAFAETITTNTDTINSTCVTAAVVAPAASGTTPGATLSIVKHVVNDNGRTQTVADFPLFVNGTPVTSGVVYDFPLTGMPYVVTETSNLANYTRTFSGDCDVNGNAYLLPSDRKICIITNDDIGPAVVVPPVPPLIDVVKVPSPLSLPGGPGPVTYTYTLRNIGTVPVTNVTLVGDTCSPIVLQSGDTNGNAQLDLTETWVHTCTTTLTATHTNTVVATGWANGIMATDIASATVVVGLPIVPPLIHITKVPSPLTLNAGGGMVTYTKTVTNPGTVPLSNVRVTDNLCSPVSFVSGDTNGDSKLNPSESWIYTCRTNLTKTTINTATAAGDANGLTARDFALATVVVAAAVPALPNTGAAPETNVLAWLAAVTGIFGTMLVLYGAWKKQTE